MEEEIKDTLSMQIKVEVVNGEVAFTTKKKVVYVKRAKQIVKDMTSNEQTREYVAGNYPGSQYNIGYGEDEAKKRVQAQSYLKKRI